MSNNNCYKTQQMNIFLDNVNLDSQTGPNHFGKKLVKYFLKQGHTFDQRKTPDAQISFIERNHRLDVDLGPIPLIQRLDGIYFDPTNDYKLQNENIFKTYEVADGIVFQSEFSKNLVFKHFGEHKNYTIIHNGADLELINSIEPFTVDREYDSLWCCASHWRPFKRLEENIRYFLEFSSANDLLIVCGAALYPANITKHERIVYTGDVDVPTLLSIFKAADYFVHLGRYDNCPNVVIDARASGCEIICASVGGTKEVAGKGATIVLEKQWEYNPEPVNKHRPLDFTKIIKNKQDSDIDMNKVAERYSDFLTNTIKGL